MKQIGFRCSRDFRTPHQCAKHRHMAEIQIRLRDVRSRHRLHHQSLHFDVALDTAVTINLGADLQRLACAIHIGGQRMQHAAGVAQSRDATAVQ
jgi:hypothetical protein